TTTPWTLPGNRAIAYGPEIEYVVLRVTSVREKSHARVGETLVLAKTCRAAVEEVAGFTSEVVAEVKARELEGAVTRPPLRGQGYDFDVGLYPGAFVTDTDGTGFVHIAPGHGVDDFELGQANGLEVPQTVAGDGTYYPHVPLFAGAVVYKSNGKPGDADE